MVKLRLYRIGKKKQPHYKIVAIDARRGPKSANAIEVIGFYNPRAGVVEVKEDRAKYWLSVGAQPSGTVNNFLVDKGILKEKVDVRRKHVVPEKEEVAEEGGAENADNVEGEASPASEKKDNEGSEDNSENKDEAVADEEKADKGEDVGADDEGGEDKESSDSE